MKLVANIITYRNCPAHLREKVAFTADQLQPVELINKMFLSEDERS